MALTSETKITVRYAETDQMGIVHHSVYPVWYEAARTEFIKLLGMSYSDMERAGVLLPLVELSCRYRGAARYEDELTVSVCVKELSPVKILFEYAIYKEGEDKPINTGTTLHAWVGRDMKPMNLKKHFPQIYALMEKTIL